MDRFIGRSIKRRYPRYPKSLSRHYWIFIISSNPIIQVATARLLVRFSHQVTPLTAKSRTWKHRVLRNSENFYGNLNFTILYLKSHLPCSLHLINSIPNLSQISHRWSCSFQWEKASQSNCQTAGSAVHSKHPQTLVISHRCDGVHAF